MIQLPQHCSELSDQVNTILDLTPKPNTIPVEADLRKVLAPKFYIVFAGAFSAGNQC